MKKSSFFSGEFFNISSFILPSLILSILGSRVLSTIELKGSIFFVSNLLSCSTKFNIDDKSFDKESNLLFYELINAFYKKTKCPILINTSFNIRSEPIVCSPKDVFRCFMGTNMDILIVGSFIMYKEEQNQSLLNDYLKYFY